MAGDSAANILRLRKLADDTAGANFAPNETPSGKRDGSNKTFLLAYQNIVTGSVYLTQNGTIRTQAGFTVDTANGILTFTAAPLAADNPFSVAYNWQWATDADYTEFLDNALEDLGSVVGGDVAEGLYPALFQIALYHALNRRAIQYARRYAASGGIAGQQVDVVTKNFSDLAEKAWKKGMQLRDDYYAKQGRKLSPASKVFGYNIDPFTPRR